MIGIIMISFCVIKRSLAKNCKISLISLKERENCDIKNESRYEKRGNYMKELLSLEDVFTKRIFRIPDYQRGYAWEEEQLIQFLEDLMNLPKTDAKHYTGLISIKKLQQNDEKSVESKWNDEEWLIRKRGYHIYHIVDGQQRLTTCIILINEIAKFIRNLEQNKQKDLRDIVISETRLSEIIEKYLVITKPNSEEQIKTYLFGYEADNPSYEYFKYKILQEENKERIIETFYTRNLENAKQFFRNAINNMYEEENTQKENKTYKKIEELFTKLTQSLQFNLYDIEDDFNTYMAFETMNNRGKKLSNLELLKNRIMYLTTLFGKPKDEENKVIQKINDTWKTIYEYLGKNKQHPLNDDEFLQVHWMIYFGYSRNKNQSYDKALLNKIFTQKRIYKTYEQQKNEPIEEINLEEEDTEEIIEENETEKLTIKEMVQYVESLEKIIPFWYKLHFPQEEKQEEIKQYLIKLNRLGWSSFKPLTVVVLSKKEISLKDKKEYLKLIERYIFIYYRFAGNQSNSLSSKHYKMAKELYDNKRDIKSILEQLEKVDNLKQINILPINGVVANLERKFRDGDGYYGWQSVRYVLYEYELNLMNDQANQKIYPENLFRKLKKNDQVSVEHIYPQTDSDPYWQENFNAYSKEEKTYLTGTLGNLLPLSQSINSSLQNDSFENKKNREPRGYKNGSHSEMEVAKEEDWTAQEILNRGLKILEFMEKRWNFCFRNIRDKYKVLFLEFLYEQEEGEKVEEVEDIVEPKKKITKEMVKYLYDKFKEVHMGRITIEEASQNVVQEKGMNSSSATMYLAALQNMVKGKGYKRRVADKDVEFLLERIKEDFGQTVFENSIKAVEEWIEYARKSNMKCIGCSQIIEKYKNK